MANTIDLDGYREVINALDRAESAFVCDGRSMMNTELRALVATHLELIRDALENCLFRDHRRLGFASESANAGRLPELAARPTPKIRARRAKITAAQADEIRSSLGPSSEIAARYGISRSRVSEIRNRIVRRRRATASHDLAARVGSKGNSRL